MDVNSVGFGWDTEGCGLEAIVKLKSTNSNQVLKPDFELLESLITSKMSGNGSAVLLVAARVQLNLNYLCNFHILFLTHK